MKKPKPIKPKPGQESVWDYPRPPRLEATTKELVVTFAGITIAKTTKGYRVLETSHPPVYYLPPAAIRMDLLKLQTARRSFCEFKGAAVYWDIVVDDKTSVAAAWSYPNPSPAFVAIKDHLAFYPSRVEACYVDGEQVQAQKGDFYGGWITSDIVGPFKGEEGTWGW